MKHYKANASGVPELVGGGITETISSPSDYFDSYNSSIVTYLDGVKSGSVVSIYFLISKNVLTADTWTNIGTVKEKYRNAMTRIGCISSNNGDSVIAVIDGTGNMKVKTSDASLSGEFSATYISNS